MTLLSGSVEERLAWHIDPNCHEEFARSRVVIEAAAQGRARIECHLRDGDRGWLWKIGRPKEFAGLPNQRAADWVFVVAHTRTRWTAHIIECKKTVKLKNLIQDVKPQWLGALRRLLALTALAGLVIDDVVFYVAFQNDKTLEDPIFLKLPLNGTSRSEHPEFIRQAREWRGELPFDLPGVDPDHFTVRRIPLTSEDAPGNESAGVVELASRLAMTP